tara:strand:- start:14179 stop:17286 length:3108 start_codon:yes stop_codon:yes gene_type:complete
MVWGTFQGYKNGLGSSNASWTPDWTIIGTIPNSDVTLLQSPVPEGVGFAIVEGQGTAAEKRLFPTSTRPSSTGTAGYTLSPEEAFNVFQQLTIERNRLVTGSGSNMAQTFAELDSILMADTHLPEDLTFELQRRGKSPDGGIKFPLKLNTSRTSTIPFIGSKDDFALAKMYYASYEQSQRIRALEDCNINILSNYLDPEVVSQIISRNRMLIQTYKKLRAQGNARGISLEAFMTDAGTSDSTVELMPQDPLYAISVKFEDQNGKEVKQLPYRLSVRGVVNFDDARQQTGMGANPGQFGSGQTLFQEGVTGDITIEQEGRSQWQGQTLGSELYHFLYAYKATGEGTNGKFPWPKGNLKITVSTPNNTEGDWGNTRLTTYSKPNSRSIRREGKLRTAEPLQVLWSENLRVEEGAYTRLNIVVPVHMEPLPMHLVEVPPESGNLKLRWEIEPNRDMIPAHQKVTLEFRVMRPQANTIWENADRTPSSNRDGYDDKILQYEEFVSESGRAASKAGVVGARAVRGMRFKIKPKGTNTWAAAKETLFVESDSISGSFSVDLCPGEYQLIRLQDLNGDGSPALIESNDEDATPFEQLPATTRAALTEMFDGVVPTGKSFKPKEFPVSRLRVPGGFYYRTIDERDTTPIGVVGAELLPRKDTGNGQFLRMTNFQLNAMFPPLPRDKDPVTDTIYSILALAYPECETQGWPIGGKSTKTTAKLFDTANIVLMDESTVDISRLGEYERRYEAERDGTSVLTPAPNIPKIGERVAYKGYYIERAYFDTSYGIKPKPIPLTSLVQFRRKGTDSAREYDMGRLASGYNASGVVEIMAYYPMQGELERTVVIPKSLKPTKDGTKRVFSIPQYDEKGVKHRLSTYNQMTLKVKTSMEAGILSGRFIMRHHLGQGYMTMQVEDAYETITKAIDAGGLPQGYDYRDYWNPASETWFFEDERLGNDEEKGVINTEENTKVSELLNAMNLQQAPNQPTNRTNKSNTKDFVEKYGPEIQTRFSVQGTQVKLENQADDDILFLPIQSDEDEEVYYL